MNGHTNGYDDVQPLVKKAKLGGQRVFVTGGSGLVGGQCAKLFRDAGWDVIATHKSFATDDTVYFNCSNENDAANFDVAAWRPHVVIHCAAMTNVDVCEEKPDESHTHNVQATQQMARLCKECGAQLVYISTDYVFDGVAGPYSEDAVPAPLSVYGKHKLEGEQIALGDDALRAVVLRITNVYGSEARGKNFVARVFGNARKTVDGAPMHMRLPSDQFATPVDAASVAAVAKMLITDKKAGVYHVASSEYVSRVQLAAKVVKSIERHQVTIEQVVTSDLGQVAPRPLKGGCVS